MPTSEKNETPQGSFYLISDPHTTDPAMQLVSTDESTQLWALNQNGTVSYGGGTPIAAINLYAVALTPAAVAANTTAEQTFAVAGVQATDKVFFVDKPTAQAGLGIVGHRVPSAGNVAITFSNNTGAGITPTAGETYQIGTIR